MAIFDLASLDWELFGWRPHAWGLGRSMETGSVLQAENGPYKAFVPGSVHRALREAGEIPDWHAGVDSRASEWLEHRHWHFRATLPAGSVPAGERVVLDAQGLDHSGWIYIGGKDVGHFEGALLPHRFDVTSALEGEGPWIIDIVFDEAPREQPQIGFSSRSQHFKPRYNYGWDWIPRIVTTGVWAPLTLRTGLDAVLDVVGMQADLDENGLGRVRLTVRAEEPDARVAAYTATLRSGDSILAALLVQTFDAETELEMKDLEVSPWWPNGLGEATLYSLDVRAVSKETQTLWERTFSVGFKRLEWAPCEGASADALPWICVVNGKPVFLQGVNWTPVRATFPDTEDQEHETLVNLYREMGCNCIRVWGGGVMAPPALLDACDRAGILVWQDFPLSSSGLDNMPPSNPEVIAKLKRIAEAYVSHNAYRACRLLWCGGNELFEAKDGVETPITTAHPCIAMMEGVVKQWDPGRRFIPSTPCGPIFYAHERNFGTGQHHLVHGPWGMGPFGTIEAWKEYWSKDDSLFRAEVGMPGAESEELIRRYAGGMSIWPPDEYWRHSSAWWIDWTRHQGMCEGLEPDAGLKCYVAHTQAEQAEALSFAAAASKGRFPRCGGIIFWHGHDCFPCPINNSLIDLDKKPKPVYFAVQKVFRGENG
jgi:beta-mannosidase